MMNNMAYHAKELGFETFEYIHDDAAYYDFDDFQIWERVKDGRLFYATDSGCSCPTPFENTSVSDLISVTTVEALDAAIEAYREVEQRNKYNEKPKCSLDRKREVLAKVKAHMERYL